MTARLLPLLACACAVLSGCPQPATQTRPTSRLPTPVTAITLEVSNPIRHLRLTGSVEPWKQENIGFAVAGRITWTVDKGEEILGRTLDENGERIAEGTVLARLDRRRYILGVKSAEADVRATHAKSLALRTEVEHVLTQDLRAAKSNRDRALKDRNRFRELVAKGAGQQMQLDRSEAEHQVLEAQVEKIKASIRAKRAELDANRARLDQNREALHRAQLNLEDCDLRGPFDGRVAALHVISGAFVSPGQPVATVVVMDPILVEVMVSPETDRSVSYGDTILIHPPGGRHEPLTGIVTRKETVADAATRTFKLSVMIRNRKVFDQDEKLRPDLPRVLDMTRIERATARYAKPGKPLLFIEEKGLQKDEQGYHVWRVRKRPPPPARRPQVEVVTRVNVSPGETRISLLGFLYRSLADPGDLEENDIVIRRKAPAGLESGDEILFLRLRWLLRPGDLVDVVLLHPGSVPGLHVPIEAILQEGGRHHLFVLEGSPGQEVARKVDVRIVGSAGELKRVEGGGLAPGTRVILEGAHQVVGGERVRVVEPSAQEEPR